MRNKLLTTAIAATLMVTFLSCSNDEKYDTAVTKDISITCDGEPYSIYFGTANRNLFIYNSDGSYKANYSMLYPLNLYSGSYKIVATDQVTLLNDSSNLGHNLSDVVIPQDTLAKTKFAVSLPTDFNSPSSNGLNIAMATRTGLLRLRATDEKADKRYATVRATVSSPITAYNVADGTFREGQTIIAKERATSNGGINYGEDFIMLETNTNGKAVTVSIDYLDAAGSVIQTKAIDGEFTILPNDTVQVSFALNNADEPMIQDFTVQIASEGWNTVDVSPSAPVEVPAGYTYVSPADNINDVFNEQKADASVSEIKLYLKAGATYSFDKSTLADCPKGFCLLGQKKANGNIPTVTFTDPISMKGTMDEVRFENLNINGKDRFFKLKNQEFHVGEIAFVNCWFNDFSGTMWYQETNAANQQVVDNLTFESCRFINLQLGKSALFGLSNKQIAPIYNWTFRNSTFHVTAMGKPLVNNLTKIDKDIVFTVENCTFINNVGGSQSWFDLKAGDATSETISVKNCLFSGSDAGTATVFNTPNATSETASSNYFTKGFAVSAWGLDMASEQPVETAETMNEMFTDAASGDLTIKATTSAVYTGKIGDNYWIK